MTTISRAPLLVLGAAVAATTGGSAEAATLVSTAGAGFTPITIGSGPFGVSSYAFDVDGDSTNDFSFTFDPTSTTNISFNELRTDVGSDSFAGQLNISQTPSQLSLSNVKHEGSADHSFIQGPAGSNYAAVATNFVPGTFSSPFSFSAGTGTLGYIQGNYTAVTAGGTSSFTLVDFGRVIDGAVPEPETWAMMILGVGGIGAMRRRQRSREAASLVAC